MRWTSFVGNSCGLNNIHNKINLVTWDRVCQPRSNGGHGLRKSHEFNVAMFMKLGWKVISLPNELWIHTLKAKYLKLGVNGPVLTGPSSFSFI